MYLHIWAGFVWPVFLLPAESDPSGSGQGRPSL